MDVLPIFLELGHVQNQNPLCNHEQTMIKYDTMVLVQGSGRIIHFKVLILYKLRTCIEHCGTVWLDKFSV